MGVLVYRGVQVHVYKCLGVQTYRCTSVWMYMCVWVYNRVGVKYSTCTWYLYLSTYLSVLDVLEYLVCENVEVLVLVLDQKVLGT